MSSDGKPRRVLVYRERLLSPSETFIRDPVETMQRWEPYLVGLSRRDSALVRDSDTLVLPGASPARRRLVHLTRRCAELRGALNRIDPHLVHAHFGTDAVAILPTVRRDSRPLVVSFHGFDVLVRPFQQTMMARLYRARLPELFREAKALIANSPFLADRLCSLGAPEHKIVVLPPGVRNRESQFAAPAVDRRGVLVVGRLVEFKGIDDAIRSYAHLPEELRSVHPLTIVGDGPERASLEQLAGALHVHASFTGELAPEQVATRMREAAVFLGPSRPARNGQTEALGMVFVEAGLAGLPVVAYASGGIPSAVADRRSAVLAPEADVVALGQALEKVLSDPARRHEMGRAGRRHAWDNFAIDQQTQRLEDLYDSVLESGPDTGPRR